MTSLRAQIGDRMVGIKEFDVVIIGAGIVGSMIAWRLSRTDLRVALLEKGSDIANGATRANSGILHSGIHEEPDSELFAMCRTGSTWYKEWSVKLDYPLQEKPSVILAHDTKSLLKLQQMQALHSETLKPQILDQRTLQKRWPFLAENIIAALVTESSAQISPYDTCRAILENAIANGLSYIPECDVARTENTADRWAIQTSSGRISSRYIVIAAGSGNNQVSQHFGLPASLQKLISGAYYMLSKTAAPAIQEIFFTPPSPTTKGILMQQTVHGNLMLGPDAIAVEDLSVEELNWSRFCTLWHNCRKVIPEIDRKEIIRTFTGERVNVGNGFQVEDYLAQNKVVRLDGIKSPGLTAAPAIAMQVEKLLSAHIKFSAKQDLKETRLSIARDVETVPPGQLVCRCEKVFISQIDEAIKRDATSIEAIRWQTRAGMGDCQGSFCRSGLIKILKNRLNLATSAIKQKNNDSQIFTGDLK